MKKRIVIGLGLFSLIFVLSGIYAVVSIERATSELDTLIRMHQVELMRERLLIEIKRLQTDLHLQHTIYAPDIDTIVAHVRNMDKEVNACFTCHHTEDVANRIETVHDQIERFKNSLSRVFTITTDARLRRAAEEASLKIGMDLVAEVNGITSLTGRKLEERTRGAVLEIAQSKKSLYALLACVPVAAIALAALFIRGFTKPLGALLVATGQLKEGNLNYRIGELRHEFGEVAESFNAMAASLRESFHRMQWAEQLVILGEMAGGLAHEIKNPLAGIKASTEVLSRDTSVSTENRAVLHMVSEQIRRIEAILKGLLNFARPPKPQFTLVQVNSVIEATVGLARQHPAFSARNGNSMELLTDLDARLPAITADPHQLQQVVMNLLINSAEAMPEGGTIALYTSASGQEPCVRIKVVDAGQGMDEETAGRIFQPFFTTKPQGTGLGLAITKGLIEQHGGNIRVENNRDQGVSFTILLPIRQGLGVEALKSLGVEELI